MKPFYRSLLLIALLSIFGLASCGQASVEPPLNPNLVNGQTEDPVDTDEPAIVTGENVPSVRGSEPTYVYIDSIEIMILESFPVSSSCRITGNVG